MSCSKQGYGYSSGNGNENGHWYETTSLRLDQMFNVVENSMHSNGIDVLRVTQVCGYKTVRFMVWWVGLGPK